MSMIEKEFASEVVNYNDLSRTMLYDNSGTNIYLMNFNTAQKFCDKYEIQLSPKIMISSYSSIQVYGYDIHIVAAMPDDEILVIDKTHSHW